MATVMRWEKRKFLTQWSIQRADATRPVLAQAGP